MAPPFAPGDDETDNPIRGRTAARRRDTTSSTPSPLVADALATNPRLIDQILEGEKAGTGDNKKKNREAETKPTHNRYEQARKINKVTLEIPLILQNPTGETGKSESLPQLRLSKNSKCSIHCHVPPSKPNGRWTGSISGNSTIHKAVGSTNGSLDLTCKLSPSCRLMGGLGLSTKATTRPFQAHVGAQYIENQDTMQVIARQTYNNTLGLHFVTKEVKDPWICTSIFNLNPRTRDFGILFSATSMTTHVLRVGFGWTSKTLSQAKHNILLALSTVQFAFDPKLPSNRRAPVSVQYQPANGTWQGSLCFQTSKPIESSNNNKSSSIPSSWRIGIQQGSAKIKANNTTQSSWSITATWQHGDFTLRIPILLGTLAGVASTSDENSSNSLVATATPYVLLAIVGMANEMLSQVLWGAQPTETKSSPPSTAIREDNPKAKQDAVAQQKLMKRTAESKKAISKEKNGLVVESAVYQVSNGEKWDVTIPLQFWVNTESASLRLAGGSKIHLLGFYPLTATAINSQSTTPKLSNQSNSAIPWWQEYWIPTAKRRKAKVQDTKTAKPTLTLNYFYKRQAFELTIGDEEALILPRESESSSS